jgi:hypothetical protein
VTWRRHDELDCASIAASVWRSVSAEDTAAPAAGCLLLTSARLVFLVEGSNGKSSIIRWESELLQVITVEQPLGAGTRRLAVRTASQRRNWDLSTTPRSERLRWTLAARRSIRAGPRTSPDQADRLVSIKPDGDIPLLSDDRHNGTASLDRGPTSRASPPCDGAHPVIPSARQPPLRVLVITRRFDRFDRCDIRTPAPGRPGKRFCPPTAER